MRACRRPRPATRERPTAATSPTPSLGDGPEDLAAVGSIAYNLEIWWEYEPVAWFWRELASFSRLIMHDRRGMGLSDAAGGGLPNLETRASDLRCVLDAVGSERATVLGVGDGGMVGAMLAATEPARVSRLAWYRPEAKSMAGEDWPYGRSPAQVAALAADAEHSWGSTDSARRLFWPTDIGAVDPEAAAWLAKMQRHAFGPTTARRYFELLSEYDVRGVLPSLHLPTLLFERAAASPPEIEIARATAALIEGSHLELIDGRSRALFFEAAPVVDLVRDFLGAERPAPVLDRVLSTVLFTDIVGSTTTAGTMGDAAWRTTLATHDRLVLEAIERYRGRAVKTTGDGVLATFDGPARAIFAAIEAEKRVHETLGLELRAGVHTGEVELRGEDVAGLAVHVAARIMGAAGASEVLTSSIVKELTAGSGLTFTDAGEHDLKGVPGPWRLYRVAV